VQIDWLKPALPFYAKTIEGASTLLWSGSHPLRVASAEGLILTKLAASRSTDKTDIEFLLGNGSTQLP
jgi:hypothetical protein